MRRKSQVFTKFPTNIKRYSKCEQLLQQVSVFIKNISENGLRVIENEEEKEKLIIKNGGTGGLNVLSTKNHIHPIDLKIIAKAIRKNTGMLYAINLSGNQQLNGDSNTMNRNDTSGVKDLFESITACNTIYSLNVSNTDIFANVVSDEDRTIAISLYTSLHPNTNSSLTTLNVSNTHINDITMKYLSNAIGINSSLLHLNISSNLCTTINSSGNGNDHHSVGEIFGNYLLNGLKTNKTLLHLDCRHNNYQNSMLLILNCILMNTNIQKLNCCGNNSNDHDEMGKLIISSIEKKTSKLTWFNGVDLMKGAPIVPPPATSTTTTTGVQPPLPSPPPVPIILSPAECSIDDTSCQLIYYLIVKCKRNYVKLLLNNQCIDEIGCIYLCKAAEYKYSSLTVLDISNNPIDVDLDQNGTLIDNTLESVALRRLAILGEKSREKMILKRRNQGLRFLCGLYLGGNGHSDDDENGENGDMVKDGCSQIIKAKGRLQLWLQSVLFIQHQSSSTFKSRSSDYPPDKKKSVGTSLGSLNGNDDIGSMKRRVSKLTRGMSSSNLLLAAKRTSSLSSNKYVGRSLSNSSSGNSSGNSSGSGSFGRLRSNTTNITSDTNLGHRRGHSNGSSLLRQKTDPTERGARAARAARSADNFLKKEEVVKLVSEKELFF